MANALGTPPDDVIAQVHDHGMLIAALAGSVKHALNHKAAGVDIVICQGSEGGGHTGDVGSIVLWPEVIDAVAPLPVLAAGGVGLGPPDGGRHGHGRGGRVDGFAVADRRGGRRAAQADGVVPEGDVARHRALTLVHGKAVPVAQERLDRGLGGARATPSRSACRCR